MLPRQTIFLYIPEIMGPVTTKLVDPGVRLLHHVEMMKMRVTIAQLTLGRPLTRPLLQDIVSRKADFTCFPEYFFVNRSRGTLVQNDKGFKKQLRRMECLSSLLPGILIAGTTPEPVNDKTYNTTFVFEKGEEAGWYRKRNLFFAEEGKITAGDSYTIVKAGGLKVGLLICADVLNPESFDAMREGGADIIFAPTFSPKKQEDPETKFARDRDIFIEGARRAGAPIVKVCGVPSPFRDFQQARSLVATENEILYRTMPDEEDTEKIITVDVPI